MLVICPWNDIICGARDWVGWAQELTAAPVGVDSSPGGCRHRQPMPSATTNTSNMA